METETRLDVQQHHNYPECSLLQFKNIKPSSTSDRISELDTVRALHQTVISLRTKLGSTEEELRRLKETVGGFSNEDYVEVVERLALENHVLRRKILRESRERENKGITINRSSEVGANVTMEEDTESTKPEIESDAKVEENAEENVDAETPIEEHVNAPKGEEEKTVPKEKPVFEMTRSYASDSDVSDEGEPKGTMKKDATLDRLDIADKDAEEISLRSVSEGDNSVFSEGEPQDQNQPEEQSEQRQTDTRNESEDESEELDDIELIFTTDETCQEVGLKEDLVSITENEEGWQNDDQRRQRRHRRRLPQQRQKQEAKASEHQQQQQNDDQPTSLKYTKSIDLAEGLVCNGGADKNNSSVEEPVSSQSSSIDREESIDRFDESSSTRLNKMWSQCSVLVETDISKCGVLEEEPSDGSAKNSARRNTLAAPFMMAYRPIIHREALALSSRRKSSGANASNAPLRPIVDYRSGGARRESGAQTDISALPAHWRSESYLAHKVAHTFTTLPSKFALPTGIPGPGKLRLSEKTREARRVMLSDISFTSMVPELSRSADHLCHESHVQGCYNNNNNNNNNSNNCSRSGLRTPEINRRESLGSPSGYWNCRYNPSHCECRLSSDLYAARYRGSLSSILSPGLEVVGGPTRRHSWRSGSHNTSAASFDALRIPVIANAKVTTPTENLGRFNCSCSMPSSPTHIHPPIMTKSVNIPRFMKQFPKRTRSKVTFQECPMSRGSLPNLHSELIGENSGDSTESLIDEAEDYLRRSIDSMLTMSGTDHNWSEKQLIRRRRTRRYSEPDLFREWNPPQDARPYLPKIPRDLKLDHLVKVISPEGKVLQGRVRYVGTIPGQEEVHVGVELPKDNGFSDGTFHGIRYFYCESNRAVFVPFKKVVLAWCTT